MKKTLLLVVFLTAVACVTARSTVIPRADGNNEVIATSGNSESAAFDAAVDEGKNYCRDMGKSFAMVNHQATTRPLPRKTRTAIDVAGSVISESQSDGTAEGARRAQTTREISKEASSNSDEYRVSVTFICK